MLAKKVLGPEHPITIAVLDNLRLLGYYRDRDARLHDTEEWHFPMYLNKMKWSGAVEKYEVDEESLRTLAALLDAQEGDDQVEQLTHWALLRGASISEADHSEVAIDWRSLAKLLSALASFYKEQGKSTQAEQLYQQTVAVYQQVEAPNSFQMSYVLGHLASFYEEKGQHERAEALYHQVVEIDAEESPGSSTVIRAYDLGRLLKLYCVQGKCEQAEAVYDQIWSMRYGRYDGEEDRFVEGERWPLGQGEDIFIVCLSCLGGCYKARGEYEMAESSYKLALGFF